MSVFRFLSVNILTCGRYASKDASKHELQALAEETFDRLVHWKSALPDLLILDMTTLDSKQILPHVLLLQYVHLYIFCDP